MDMKLFLFCLLLSCAVTLRGQDDYRFSTLGSSDGLVSDMVTSIYKDSRGYMWFGTLQGLSRYDGYGYSQYVFVKNDTTSLPNNRVRQIQEDSEGMLWIYTDLGYSLYDYRTESFRRDATPALRKRGLFPSPDFIRTTVNGDFLACYRHRGVYLQDARAQVASLILPAGKPGVDCEDITDLWSTENEVWIAHLSGEVQRYNKRTKAIDLRTKVPAYAESGSFILPKRLFIDSDGMVWIYPWRHASDVAYFNPQSGEWQTLETTDTQLDKMVSGVQEDRDRRIWISSDHGGIWVYDKQTGSSVNLLHTSSPYSIVQNSVTTLYCDRLGTMWAGTYKTGVSYWHPDLLRFKSVPVDTGYGRFLSELDCNCFHEDPDGQLWIGTDEKGLIRYSPSDGTYHVFSHNLANAGSLTSNIIIAMSGDSKGNLWIGTFMGGLVCMDRQNRFKRYFSEEISEAYGVCVDKADNLWVGTLGKGVYCISPDRRTYKVFTKEQYNLYSNHIQNIQLNRDSTALFVCTGDGVNVIDLRSGNVSTLFRNTGLQEQFPENNVNCLLEDSRGLVWIGNNYGVYLYDRRQERVYTVDSTYRQVMSFIEDGQGNIWIGTSNGLLCAFPQRQDDGGWTFPLVSYNRNDGLVSQSFNLRAICRRRNGEIVLGTTRGFYWLAPRDILFPRSAPQVVFTGLSIQNEPVLPGRLYDGRKVLEQALELTSEITLKYDEKNLTIHVSTLDFLHPMKTHYRYRLKGLEQEWTLLSGGQSDIRLDNLPSGSYDLQVYAGTENGVWGDKPTVLHIVKLPPFWKTWWAYMIYGALGLLLTFYVYLYFLNRAKEKYRNEQRILKAKRDHELDEMKLRFFTNISHEFRTPLTLILNPTEKLLRETSEEQHKALLNIVRKNALSLLHLVNQLLDFRKIDVLKLQTINYSVGDVVRFTQNICNSFVSVANEKKIALSFLSSIDELNISFDHDKYQKIVMNLLSNALKFTPSMGKIEVNVSITELGEQHQSYLKTVVKDNGIGIAKEHLDRIFERFFQVNVNAEGSPTGTGIGLHIVNEYVKLLQGKVTVESTLHKGTTFTVLLPISTGKELVLNREVEEPEQPGGMQSEETDAGVQPADDGKDQRPLVLIVDDNADFRHFMQVLVGKEYRTITASDGKEACERVMEQLPDLIVCDVMMPVMDGIAFCQWVKNDIRFSHIPVILLTAKTSDESKYEGTKAGAEDYIAKPFNMDLLLLKVAQLVERQKREQEKYKKKIDINPSSIEVEDRNEVFIRKAVQVVEQNMENPEFNVEELSKAMNMSRTYFYKKIMTLVGKSPVEFIRYIRIRRAADLLEKSSLFINEIAYQVGFNDVKYFRKYFKSEFGMSPLEYRKKMGNDVDE